MLQQTLRIGTGEVEVDVGRGDENIRYTVILSSENGALKYFAINSMMLRINYSLPNTLIECSCVTFSTASYPFFESFSTLNL